MLYIRVFTKAITVSASALALFVGCFVVAGSASAAEGAGDAAAGKTAYGRCAACHSITPGRNGVGPSLFGVVGRKAGSLEGFKYSDAMVESDVIWSTSTLDSHLADVKGFIPGNRMGIFYPAGVANADDRANIIAYLETLTE